jgi:PAS domain S-box-containing protein
MYSLEGLVLLIASSFSLALIFFQIPIKTLQQFLLILLVLLLIGSRFLYSYLSKSKAARLVFISLSASLVQILVISSGGFYSPFLILLHLYTLGSSFLLNLQTAVIFLMFSLGLLVVQIKLDPDMLKIFNEDPFSVVLYIVSFFVVIPLAQFLINTYKLKSTISNLLGRHIQISERREESIVQGLNELVIVTDLNLLITDSNDTIEKALGLSADEIKGKSLLDIVPLRYQGKVAANIQLLSIDQIIKDKLTRIVNGFYFQDRVGSLVKVVVQIKPVIDSEEKISQLVFVISDETEAKLHPLFNN